jgi:hypothetical protein
MLRTLAEHTALFLAWVLLIGFDVHLLEHGLSLRQRDLMLVAVDTKCKESNREDGSSHRAKNSFFKSGDASPPKAG